MHKHHRALGVAPNKAVSVLEIAKARPVQPVTLIRPHAARRAARFFSEKFPGRVALCREGESVPRAPRDAVGGRHHALRRRLDRRGASRRAHAARGDACASCTRSRPRRRSARPISRMVSAPSRSTARKSSTRSCAPPTARTDLTLCVRLRVSSDHSKLSLASKFGVDLADAAPLLMAARQVADALGICFHVGSAGDEPAGLFGRDGARARGDRLGGGHGRRDRRRRGLPLLLSGDGAAAARALFPHDPRGVREPAGVLFGRTVVRARPRAVGGICLAAGPRRAAPRRRALHQRRRLWRAVRRRAYRLALPGQRCCASPTAMRATSASASTARPATTWIAWPARSSCPPTRRPATSSRSACWAPMAARCAPPSTASPATRRWSSRTSR